MATIKTYSADDMRNARKAGFKKKRPRKPKSKTYTAMSNYIDRYNQWVSDLKEKAKQGKQMENLKKQISKAR